MHCSVWCANSDPVGFPVVSVHTTPHPPPAQGGSGGGQRHYINDLVPPQQKWKWTRIHNISLVRYMGRARDSGLRKLREELEAEDTGVHIPAEIRWLCGAKARARFQANKDGPSSW